MAVLLWGNCKPINHAEKLSQTPSQATMAEQIVYRFEYPWVEHRYFLLLDYLPGGGLR